MYVYIKKTRMVQPRGTVAPTVSADEWKLQVAEVIASYIATEASPVG